MKNKLYLAAAASLLAAPISTLGVVIDFTGGNAYRTVAPSPVVADNVTTWGDVDYYEEDGFKLDFIPTTGYIGNYYNAGNSVIHGHWDTGDFGDLTLIRVSKIDGTTFDLNYFILTSNTDTGGGTASGSEQAFIRNNNGNDILLPSENWGFPATQIFLPGSYDGITYFEFYVTNPVDCFGMDEFYIDEPAPPPTGVPDGGSTALMLGAGLAVFTGFRKRFSA